MNKRFQFFDQESKNKKSLDQTMSDLKGDKNSMIAVAAAVIGIKQKQLQIGLRRA